MRNRFNGGNHIAPGLPAETETMLKRREMPKKPPHSLPSNQLFKFFAVLVFWGFFSFLPFKLPLRNWAGSLFLEGVLGREKQVLPGGVD